MSKVEFPSLAPFHAQTKPELNTSSLRHNKLSFQRRRAFKTKLQEQYMIFNLQR